MRFKFDEFVWAKLKGYSPWPGKIMFGHSSDPPSKKKVYKYVYFFGSHNHAWISLDNLYKYVPYRKMFAKKLQTKTFKDGVKYIANEHKGLLELKRDRNSGYPSSESEDESEEEEETPRRSRRISKPVIRNRILKKKMHRKNLKDFTVVGGVYVLRSEADQLKDVSVKIVKMKPKLSIESTDSSTSSESSDSSTNTTTDSSVQLVPSSSKMHLNAQGEDSSFCRLSPEVSVIQLTDTEPNSSQTPLKLPEVNKMCDIPSKSIEKNIILQRNLKRSAAPVNMDPKLLPSVSITPVKSLQVKASAIGKKYGKRLGFVGLGCVGQNIVKTFLASGYTVNVWSGSPKKYDDIIRAGAYQRNTPAEVVASSEIIFCCLSKADDLEQIMFSQEGVLKGFKDEIGSQKIYVDLTTVKSKTLGRIQAVIHLAGGLFFEAVVLGSMTGVDCASLIFLCAGNIGVFEKIRPCLNSITGNIHYFGSEFGAVAKKNMTFYAVQGILFSGLHMCTNYVKNKDGFNLRELKSIIQAIPDEETLINTSLKTLNRHFIAALTVDNDIKRPLSCASVSHDTSKRGYHVHFEDDDDDVIILEP